MATELDPNTAWQTAPIGHTLRSRYTGYPLNENEMVITILSQGSFTFGHQVIVFEWGHGYETDDCYRKHKGFHLYPARGNSLNELGLLQSSRQVVPGRIERFRRTIPLENGDKASEKPEDGNLHKGRYYAEQARQVSESNFLIGAKYRSWLVDFNSGNRAFNAAKAEWKNATQTPKFNLLGHGGHNCGTWAQHIASIAGIKPTSTAARIGFPVPAWEVYGCGELSSEQEMWEKRV
ncbi:hypothetical protein GNX18_01245 [Microbulbifer sp. SH-1]|uniref:hypothetical protein n=1 Tax=Microbulbifer sp. SH-1 TaxID=2681547 RepID=UPI00140C800D|nr:hypothetical protein [Microbulbifer sp. SH-1]QIL88546.1 hypothetical protein GNX18_01245 [Microbulbifer sp. SH-1]